MVTMLTTLHCRHLTALLTALLHFSLHLCPLVSRADWHLSAGWARRGAFLHHPCRHQQQQQARPGRSLATGRGGGGFSKPVCAGGLTKILTKNLVTLTHAPAAAHTAQRGVISARTRTGPAAVTQKAPWVGGFWEMM